MWPAPYRELRAIYGEAQGLSGEIRWTLGLQSERALALAAEEAVLSEAYRRIVPNEGKAIGDLAAACKARIAVLLDDPDLPPEMRPAGR